MFSPGSTIKQPLLYSKNPHLITTIQLDSQVRGIIVIVNNQELFLVCERSPEVFVYNACTYVYKTKFLVEGLRYPRKITSANNTLFISSMDEIYRVKLSDSVQSTKWTVSVPINGMSVTDQGNLLLSCRSIFGGLCKLYEYSQDGILQREIVLPTEVEGLNHAIRIDNDRLLLTHANFAIGTHRVCLVDNTGKLINSCHKKHIQTAVN